jgi:acyl-CoA reductase-like NAD-dependent aldehyde dehydrogenase
MSTRPFELREWSPFIDGEFVIGHGAVLEVENPATGEAFSATQTANEADVDGAVGAARAAFESWGRATPAKRAEALFAVADVIAEHRDELIELETWENGKPLVQSKNDVVNAEKTFRFYAGATDKFYGQAVSHSEEEVRSIVFEPYGVVAAVIPWNWPPMHTGDFGALALATGNTMVMKPAPETPLSTLRMAELMAAVLPPGVFNVIPGGIDPGAQLVAHPDIDFITFTGASATGSKILRVAAERILPTMMELGGKNASVIFGDVDMEKAVAGMRKSAFFNSGQACSGSERILVEKRAYEPFLEAYAEQVREIRVGEGFDPASEVGPMVSRRHFDKVRRDVERAVEDGAVIVAQSDLPDDPRLAGGHWFAPTVLTGMDPADEIMQEEVFGPVVSVVPFEDEDDAAEIANGTKYGLTAGVWTRDLGKAHRMAARIEAGLVAVNTPNNGRLGLPFGGYKQSGLGRKKDFHESMRSFSRAKSIHMTLP